MLGLIGLGNPGDQYQDTRHNIGFRFLDFLAQEQGLRFNAAPRFRAHISRWQQQKHDVLCIKPQTFMNNSGEAVAPLAAYHKIDSKALFVIYDDLDMPEGKIRLKTGGGHGGHNGLRSLHQHLPDNNYHRIKIGIGRPEYGDISSWVLGKTTNRSYEQQLFRAIYESLDLILDADLAKASNRIHQTLANT